MRNLLLFSLLSTQLFAATTGAFRISDDASFLSTTASTSSSTGALVVPTGGIGIAGTSYFGANVYAGTAFRGPSGSTSVTSFSHNTNASTGFYFPSSISVGFAANGTQLTAWSASGLDTLASATAKYRLMEGLLDSSALEIYRTSGNAKIFNQGAFSLGLGANSIESLNLSSAGIVTLGATSGVQAHRVNGQMLRLDYAAVGNTGSLQVRHSDNTSATSHAIVYLETGGASGGDPKVQYFVTGGQDWAAGIDNSASDAYVISNSANLGTNNAMSCSTGLTCTFPVGISTPSLTNTGALTAGTAGDSSAHSFFGATLTLTSNATTQDASLQVINSSTNAAADASLVLQTANTSAGDPYINFKEAGVADYSLGIDNSDSDKFKLSYASSLGTTDLFTFAATSGGAWTLNQTGTGTISASAVKFGDGSQANPVITNSTATSTGLYFVSATPSIGLAANGGTVAYGALTTGFQILGTPTNDSASAGYVGEYVSQTTGMISVPGASGAWADCRTISLTAGDWDVTAVLSTQLNGATMTQIDIGISATSGNSATGLTQGDNSIESSAVPVGTAIQSVTLPEVRVSIAGTTSYYLKCNFTYAVATPQYAARLSARRVR